jgi:hypothetical protein
MQRATFNQKKKLKHIITNNHILFSEVPTKFQQPFCHLHSNLLWIQSLVASNVYELQKVNVKSQIPTTCILIIAWIFKVHT